MMDAQEHSIQFDGKEWELSVHRNMGFWHVYCNAIGDYHYLGEYGLNAHARWLFITKNGTDTFIFRSAELSQPLSQEIEQILTDKTKFLNLKESINNHMHVLKQVTNECLEDVTASHWSNFLDQYLRSIPTLAITLLLGRIGTQHLLNRMKALNIPETDLSLFMESEEFSPFMNSRIRILEIATKIQTEQISSEAIQMHLIQWVNDFGYLPVNYIDEPWDINFAQKELDQALQLNALNELNNIKSNHIKRIHKANQFANSLGNKEISALFYIVKESGSLNEYRKNVFSYVSYKMQPFLMQIAKLAQLESWRQTLYLTPDEITDIIKGNTTDARSLCLERQDVGGIITSNGDIEFLDSETVARFISAISPQKNGTSSIAQVQSIKGLTANKGYAQGTVKIVRGKQDFGKFNEGDILVAPMTSVDFLPIMAIAGAFITDEGGITSHAAIVARELNKPCIIGTKNATRMLRDGDNVVVDTTNGTVRHITITKETPQ